MTSNDRLKTLLLEALELPAEARAAWLDEACGGDSDLRARLERLLAAHGRAGDVFGTAAGTPPLGGLVTPAPDPAALAAADLAPGQSVGPYRLEEQLGAGGFGVVFRASQEEPVRRQVALKVLRLGMDSRSVLARFEQERQALALMDHPNIARVYDAGVTEAGRPYFVMELVDGLSITEHCERAGLGVRERLALFVQAAHAVEHAHRRGVLHRDLKPSNVLVAEVDGEPQPRLIDFGIAKAIREPLTDASLQTREGFLLGTPAYMSPEQIDRAPDVDTRSDVYALGVLLYELLSGQSPFDVDGLGLVEAMRTIREKDPPRPSTRRRRATGSEDARRSDPAVLAVPPELDWIVMRCLEKERDRRYASARDLALDAERFLRDEPLEAAPPSAVYRLRKLARRHRGVALALAGTVLALLLGTIGTTLGLVRAERSNVRLDAALQEASEANRALDGALAETRRTNEELDQALDETEEANRQLDLALLEARRQTAVAEAINDFLIQDLLGAARPTGQPGRGPQMPVVDLLDLAAAELDAAARGRFATEPAVEASLRYTIGVTFDTLGRFEEAARQLERCVELRDEEAGGSREDRLLAMSHLAMLQRKLGDAEAAVALQGECYELSLELLGPFADETLRAAARLANALRDVGRGEEGLELLEEVTPEASAVLGEGAAAVTDLNASLAILYADHGRYEEAAVVYEAVLEAQTALLGPESPVVLNATMNLASLRRALGRSAESEAMYREVIEVQRRVEGPSHPHTLLTMLNLAECLLELERWDEVEAILGGELAAAERAWGASHPRTFHWMETRARGLEGAGHGARALELLDELLTRAAASPASEHPTVAKAREGRARLAAALGAE